MKKKFFYVVMALCNALLFFSCDKNEEALPKSGNETAALRVSVDICKNQGLKTRSALAAFPDKSEIGIFATSGTLGSNYNGVVGNANVKTTLSGSAWTTSPAIYLSNHDATLFAYYPYNSASTDGSAIPVEHKSQTDYLYGTHTSGQTGINNGNPSVNLTMQHALALLQFKISKTNYSGAGILSKIEIANAAGKTVLSSAGALNISTGKITNTAGKNESAVIENGNLQTIPETAATDESTYPKIMVLPASITTVEEVEMRFTIDGKIYTSKVNASTEWAKGTKNTYTVTIQGTGLTLGNVVISDWTDGVTGSVNLQ